MSKTTDSISSTCVLCCQDTKLFAIGPCDHPICTKCSTRMRVLCEQKYCSVCRNEMGTVLFVKKVHPYASIITHKFLSNKKAGIRFASGWMKNEFEDYLSHKCPKCPKDVNQFKSLKLLEEHMRRTHELYYCNLCIDNVKVFTHERRLYNRKDLAIHKRKGDVDNTSYRGHPLCEFCDVRFYDNDELLKHLRRQHYFCHFCENDGITNQYYDNYENLREHFRQMHYLCEEGACIDEEFTAAFRSAIDLKAHKALKHTSKMSKKEAKQVRQLDWEFNYASHRSTHRDGVITGADYNETHGSYRGRGRGFRNQSNREHDDTAKALEASLQTEQPDIAKEKRPPKRRDKPRGEKTEKVQKANVKPENLKKQRPFIKEDEFEKRRAASTTAVPAVPAVPTVPAVPIVPAVAVATATTLAAVPKNQKKENKLESHFDNSKNAPSDWSVGNELTSCQFTESTWKNEKDISKLSDDMQSKNEDEVEQKSVKSMSSVRIESKPVEKKEIDQTLNESDFPSLGKVVTSSGSSWGKVVPDANDFPALGPSANSRKPVPAPNCSSAATSEVSQKSELHVDFSKAIAANAMLHDKKKRLSQLPPQPPPPPTQSYEDFPTLSSIANILKVAPPEPKQAWTKNKQAPEVVSTKKASKNTTMMHSQTTSQPKEKIKEKPVKEKNKQTTNSNPENEKKFNSNGLHTKDQSTSAKAEKSKPSKKKNIQITNSNPQKENKINSNDLHTKDQSISAKAEKSKPSHMENPSVVSTKPEEIAKLKDDPKESDIDSDSRTTRMPPGFPPQPTDLTPKRFPPGLSLPTTTPPPGFNTGSNFNPPPGFSVASGFVEPSNFKQRNKDLIDKIQMHLNYDCDGFNEFKRLSGQFRQGNLSGKDYYESCSGLLGKDNFQNIFPDLVSLLPDTEKQQELLSVNNDYKILAKSKGEKVLSIKKKGSSVWRGQEGQNENTVCNDCGQVLLQKDLSSHMDICSINTDFPSLAAASASSAPRQSAMAWGRVK